jgi:carbamoyltransferase
MNATMLGVNFSGADPNAALVVDGEIAAAAEEERFTREKHATGQFPKRALRYCLDEAARRGRKIDAVAFGWDGDRYADGSIADFYDTQVNAKFPVDDATRAWQKRMIATFHRDAVTRQIHDALVAAGFDRRALPPVRFLGHHRTHAAGAYLLSRFEKAAVLTLDGSGDDLCTALWKASDGRVERTAAFPIPHSLGWFYAAMTEYLGFEAYDGEYKVMGLAPYGKSDGAIREKLARVVKVSPGGYALDPRFIHYGRHSHSGRFTDDLVELLGRPPRGRETDPTEHHKGVAFEAQDLFERACLAVAARAVELGGDRRLCLSGGAALNCKMSQRVLESELMDDVFVLPNAGDGGQSLSAAVLLSTELTGRRPAPLETLALGPSWTDDEVKSIIDECLLPATRPADVASAAAEDVAAGKVVGWFQGRMEFGPRALGQRSILADPRRVESRDKVNRVVKYREYWRPFCPSVLAEAAPRYFSKLTDALFMAITLPATAEARREMPAVVHVDGTARPQLVRRETLPLYHDMIRAFGERTGVPAVLNTSFNVKGEPIVCTPRDAIRNFYSCGLDVLYLGPFRIEKRAPG